MHVQGLRRKEKECANDGCNTKFTLLKIHLIMKYRCL